MLEGGTAFGLGPAQNQGLAEVPPPSLDLAVISLCIVGYMTTDSVMRKASKNLTESKIYCYKDLD